MKIALQIIAVCCTLSGVILSAYKRRLCWVIYQCGGVAWVTLYAISHLYIAILAQIIFMVANVFGFIKWGKHG
jgi:hypothetical protein